MQQYKAKCLTWNIESNFVIAVQRNFQGVIWQHTVSVSGEEHLKETESVLKQKSTGRLQVLKRIVELLHIDFTQF